MIQVTMKNISLALRCKMIGERPETGRDSVSGLHFPLEAPDELSLLP